MKRDLGVQLYSLREYAKTNFVEVLEFVAETGYKIVEPAGFWNLSVKEFKKVIDDLGLKIVSSHSPWIRSDEDIAQAVDDIGVLGLDKVVCGFGPNDFKDMDAIKSTAEKVNRWNDKLAAQGVTLFQHNHNFEFEMLDGRLKYDIYAELATGVKFQIDAFWSSNFGANDPAEMVKKFAPRMVSLHLKDGSFETDSSKFKMVNGFLDRDLKLHPLGQGLMKIDEIVQATPESVKDIIVELDYCVIEMREALKQSYNYMTGNGFAVGNK